MSMTADELKALGSQLRECRGFGPWKTAWFALEQAAAALAEYAELKAKLESGWVMVPREPNWEMMVRGSDASGLTVGVQKAAKIYRAMLAAVEGPQEGGKDG
jgi:hypothetical protein